MITSRNVQILKHLSIVGTEQSKVSSIDELSKHLNVSERTIRYDLDNINYFLKKYNLALIEKSYQGKLTFSLSEEQWKPVIIDNNLYELSNLEREDFLAIRLFFSHDYVLLNSITDELHVGATTIRRDLDKLKSIYQEQGVTFQNKSRKGIKVIAEDKVMRNIQLGLVLKYLYNYDRFISNNSYDVFKTKIIVELHRYLDLETLNPCKDFIKSIQLEMQNAITDELHSIILSYIIVMVVNLKSKQTLKHVTDESFINTTTEYKIVQKSILSLEKTIGLKINIFEVLALTDVFISSCLFKNGSYYYDNWINISWLTQKLMNEMDKNLSFDIRNDKELFKNLNNHLKPMIYRIKNNIPLTNELSETDTDIPEHELELVENACKVLSDTLKTDIPRSEIIFIYFHFKLSIDKHKPKTDLIQAKNVLIVCSHGYGISNLIAQQLKKEFIINIINVIPLHKLNNVELNNLDYIITTTALDIQTDIPTININPILQDEDLAKLDQHGLNKRQNIYITELMNIVDKYSTYGVTKHKEMLATEILETFKGLVIDNRKTTNTLQNLMPVEHILLNQKYDSWQQVVDNSVGLLINTGAVEQSYLSEIHDIINTVGEKRFIIKDGIVLLHASALNNINKTAFSLLTLQQPIKFPQGYNIDIILCLSSHNYTEHTGAMMELLDILQSPNLQTEIMNLKNNEDFFKIGQ